PSNSPRTQRMPGTRSSAATKCISDVPGFVKQTSTFESTKVRTRLSAPFMSWLSSGRPMPCGPGDVVGVVWVRRARGVDSSRPPPDARRAIIRRDRTAPVHPMQPELGIVEGFFGRPWPWQARRAAVAVLSSRGYRFYLYAPKADASLRRDWRSPLAHPRELAELARHCAGHGVRFGVGLTPFGTHLSFGTEERAALADKVAEIDATGATELAILFDDMDGGPDDLASRQAAIVEFAAARTRASRICVCPSYYSDDPLLDRVFGRRPARYLETLAAALDARIGIFWTGEEVCSREITPGHLDDVAQRMGRKPIRWDNYPVNDGPTMSQRLHLRGFTGRNARIGASLAAHAVNPALQPTLSLVPMLTLVDCYREG